MKVNHPDSLAEDLAVLELPVSSNLTLPIFQGFFLVPWLPAQLWRLRRMRVARMKSNSPAQSAPTAHPATN